MTNNLYFEIIQAVEHPLFLHYLNCSASNSSRCFLLDFYLDFLERREKFVIFTVLVPIVGIARVLN
jgi:hypothetical protein